MVVHRSADLVTVTRSVIAINHTARTRLRCSWYPYAVGNGMTGEHSSIVLERYEECVYHDEEGREAIREWDWVADEDTRIPATEQRIDGVRGAMGTPYAYCAVYSLSQLHSWAAREGMTWCARERVTA